MRFTGIIRGTIITALIVAIGGTTAAGAASPAVANVDNVTAVVNAVDGYVNVLGNDQRGQGGPFNAPAIVRTSSGATTAGGAFACSFTACRYTAPAGYLGPDSFPYSLGFPLPGGATTSAGAGAVVNVTVVANQPPTAVDDAATTVGRLPVSVPTTSNDLDPNLGQVGERLLPVMTTSSSTFGGTVQCGDDGFGNLDNCVYRAAEGFTGSDTFTYTVADTNGATSTATVSIEVTPNEAPTAVDDAASFAVVYSGGPPERQIDVTANDTDPEGQVLAAAATAPSTTQGGAVSCEWASCTYTPPDGFVGTDTFQYVAADGAGGLSSPATVTVTITVDLPPVAEDDTATARGTAPVVIPVFDNDTDDAADLRLDGFDATGTAGGTVSCTSESGTGIDHGCTYRAQAGFVGTDTFTYRVTDATGGQNTDTATVTVTVVANADPSAHDDVFDRRNENCCDTAPYYLEVTSNDTDPEGDALDLPLVFLSTAAGADVVCAADSCEYTPPATLVPTDSFEYTVSDGHGGSSTATVTVYLLDNAPPQARDDIATALRGQTVTIPVASNDVDPSWWELYGAVAADATSAAGGSISCTDLGSVTNGACDYTPPAGFVGIDTFGYVLTDRDGETDAATVTIVVSDEETTSETVPPGGTVGTDDEADGATDADPVETIVQLGATGGAVSITERPTQTPPPTGYALLGTEVVISAPAATPADPIRLTFLLDASLVPAGVLAGDVVVFRNGAAVADCTGTPGTASPDPCVAVRADLAGGDIRIEALTSAASTWGLGVESDPGEEPLIIPRGGIVLEGDVGTTTLQVLVELSEPTSRTVSAEWSTASLAVPTAGVDYETASGTVVFEPGETTATIPITVYGDTLDEGQVWDAEWGALVFSDPTNGSFDSNILGAVALMLIVDDDPPPVVAAGVGAVVEGDAGTTTLTIPLTLSAPSGRPVTVDWSTVLSVQPEPGVDFEAGSGTVTFEPGQTTATIAITVHGDTVDEPGSLWGAEWGAIELTNPQHATFGTGFLARYGLALIVDDD